MQKQDSPEFALLAERRVGWRTVVASYSLQILFLLFLVGVRLLWPEHLQFARNERITELIPLPISQPEPPKIDVVQPASRPEPPPVRISAPKLIVPKELVVRTEKPPDVAPPQIETDFKPPQLRSVPVPKVIYTGTFGGAKPAAVEAPIEKVQTGGFGDPNGLPGDGKDNAHLPSARLGSFDLPPGSGHGNGVGGAKGVPAVIASAGFGNGIAQGIDRRPQTMVQPAGFATQETSHVTPKVQNNSNGPLTSSVEILSKPNPVYTPQAIQLKIEGEVLLEVMFGANGQLHVNQVIRGLGYGLDEAAVDAANKIKFKPATRDGSPADSTAVVHVVFKMAY